MGATERIRVVLVIHIHLGQTKVCQLDMASSTNEYIVRFEISVQHAIVVKILESEEYLTGIDSCNLL